ncbi:MAG TPA: hypothetical protein PKH10_01590 [bacterium]|nr:hypothetical protein [bacterium]HSA33751.1 hypothetical protein [bacterium]
MKNKKFLEAEVLSCFQEGAILLPPLVTTTIQRQVPLPSRYVADALMDAVLPQDPETKFRFVVEAKSQSTPMIVQRALLQVKEVAGNFGLPLILVPYLASERLQELEQAGVSGVDLCGNGIVIVPGRIYILRTGEPNKYKESRPLNNPYRGRSAMVARMLLMRPRWNTLKELQKAIENAGTRMVISQVSKAVQALEEERMIVRSSGAVTLADAVLLLDKLSRERKKPAFRSRQAVRLPLGFDSISILSTDPLLRWAVTGESSVSRYATFGQEGPRRIAVSDMTVALKLLGGKPEPVLNFADVELLETDEPGYYFGNDMDNGIRWAGKVQTWLELSAGDARQQEAAADIRKQILSEVKI